MTAFDELNILRLRTVAKLKSLQKFDGEEIDKAIKKVLKGNENTVHKVINKYLRFNKIQTNTFFSELFTGKRKVRMLKKLPKEAIKRIISLELDPIMRKYSKKKKYFQETVDLCVYWAQQCELKKVRNLAMWIIDKYKYKKVVKGKGRVVVNVKKEYKKKLLKKGESYRDRIISLSNLFDHLEYIEYLRQQISEYKISSRLSKKYLGNELKFHKEAIKRLGLEKELISKIKKDDYKITDDLKYEFTKARKEFNRFVTKEIWGDISEVYYKEKNGVVQRCESAVIDECYKDKDLYYTPIEENCLNVEEKNLNLIRVVKSKYPQKVRELEEHPHVNIIDCGKWGENPKRKGELYYVVYEYRMPKSFLTRKKIKVNSSTFLKLEETHYEYDLVGSYDGGFVVLMDPIDHAEFMYDLYSLPDYLPILNKKLENSEYGETVDFEIVRHPHIGKRRYCLKNLVEFMKELGMVEDGYYIPDYKIYLRSGDGDSRRKFVFREGRYSEYLKLYKSRYHKIEFSSKGKLVRGGNILKRPLKDTGYESLNKALETINALKDWSSDMSIVEEIKLQSGFFDKMVKKIKENKKASTYFVEFLNELKNEYIYRKVKAMKLYSLRQLLREKYQEVDGRTKKGKRIKKKLQKVPDTSKMVWDFRTKELMLRKALKEFRRGKMNPDVEQFLRNVVGKLFEKYADVKQLKRVRISRHRIGLIRLMINNLQIDKETVKLDFEGNKKEEVDTFQFFNKTVDIMTSGKYKEVSLNDLLSCCLRMFKHLGDSQGISKIEKLLKGMDLEDKEKKLLDFSKSV